MSNARKLADNLPTEGQLGARSFIINGGMEISQRGISSTSSGYVSLDRWYVNQSGASTTFSQETNSNPSETGGLQKYARLNVSSSSDYCHIRQPIEDVTTVPAGTVTLSFYAKGTAPAGGLYTYGNQHFGSGGSSDVDWTPVLITSTLTSNWVRYTAQITVPSLDGKTVGAGSYFLLDIGQHSNNASTAFDLNITGVMLEEGSQASPFEHEPTSVTLAKAQRYFYKMTNNKTSWLYAVTTSHGSGLRRRSIHLPVTMRTTPTATISITHTGGTSGVDGGVWIGPDSVGVYVNSINAETDYAYTSALTADAEL